MKKKVYRLTVEFCGANHRDRFRRDIGPKSRYNIVYDKKKCWVCDALKAAGY